MDISFKFDPEILIGADTLSMAGTLCTRYGRRVMIAADHSLDSQTVARLKDILEDSGIEAIVFDGIEENSSVDMAENIVELAQAGHCNAIIGFGGHKTQIVARMAAIMAPVRLSAFDLLDGRLYQNRFLPLIAIPTEGLDTFSLTEFFIAIDPRSRLIKLIQSPGNLFSAVIIDSNLYNFLSGKNASVFLFDGFLSALEAYCSSKANFLSDALLERALNFYTKLLKSGNEGISAEIFAHANFLSALGASASSPGAGGALAYAINARFPILKQRCSAALLPSIAEKLVSARPEKMARLAGFLGNVQKAGSVAEAANSATESINKCMEAFNLKGDLKEFNLNLDKLTASAVTGRNLEFVANSPWTVSEEEVFEILRGIL